MKFRYLPVLLLICSVLFLSRCEKDPDPSGIDDDALFALVQNNNFVYYKGANTLLSGAGDSPHGSFKLRFNAKAASVLDASGKLPAGVTFPDSSIVLKEVYSGNTLQLLVPMMKFPSHNQSASGWLWAEYGPSGKVVYALKKEGSGCTGCHGGSTNRDFIRSFDLH
jgi:hypothetical protein